MMTNLGLQEMAEAKYDAEVEKEEEVTKLVTQQPKALFACSHVT